MNEKLNDALNEISEKHISEAANHKQKKTRYIWFSAVAAVLIVAILVGLPAASDPYANRVAAAEYPQLPTQPKREDYSDSKSYQEALALWHQHWIVQHDQPEGYADSLTDFFSESISLFLDSDENRAYSPLNLYMALAMVAETADGNSRQQLLDLFGLSSIDELRTQTRHVWNAHYYADGVSEMLLANSLWLDDSYDFKSTTADLLATDYYASVYRGDLGSAGMNQQLQSWLNEQTGDLLKDQAKNVEMNAETVLALASTVYFAADWLEKFEKENTKAQTFHAPNGDVSADFMCQTEGGTYYYNDDMGAVNLRLSSGSKMWLFLPNEGRSISDILENDDYLKIVMDPGQWQGRQSRTINLQLPKFDISSQADLISGMKQLGVTDIFDSSVADFSAITDTTAVYVEEINHAVRVAIDEEGVTAVGFTYGGFSLEIGDVPRKLDFILDRPFLFIISSPDNLPLFAGVVNEP